mmetsp:Transcript_17690/g.21117  ORF Transcript_17690/g.21117 Transcript_17690/m.21117 type:complete len:189 (+) Transcript_17690:244-810(+)
MESSYSSSMIRTNRTNSNTKNYNRTNTVVGGGGGTPVVDYRIHCCSMSTSGGSGKRGRDGQLKCSLSHSTYSESATRSASMESSDYDFSTTGGSCLLGPFSVASDYDDDDDDDAYYANNSVLDKVVKGVGYDPDTNEKEEDTNVNQLMDSTTMTMIRRRETNDDDNGGIQPPPPHHHHHHHQQQQRKR